MKGSNLKDLKEIAISKEDFKKYFNGKKIIDKKDYEEYMKLYKNI